ncbi:Oidioi.mRNA.OKI2018_I69.XSR.g13450.t1.cds [Oikopleura dioica]|uniref:Oidioi.mRNA.OKI2018_I69.XSR.g13450.t1.cds n=1 Tax=Oikopleura dioica TaxID=34765 RepID=A0ABN7SAS6_OIKDI|nr:Oidioi.mRNA.OKI2018_I69.XSR.g13450.t1.cds [Oikopleura dioica]
MLGLIVEGPSDQGIALEFCSGGALNQWLKHHKDRLHLQQSIQWCLQIGKGMEYLHKRAPASFLHRDLKSSNILLLYPGATDPSKQVLKISDFGLARARREQQSHEEFTTAGTYAWMAPESIRSSNFSPASDVWSFGVLVWEILTGEVPYRGMEPLQVALAVAQRQLRLPVPESIPQILASVMRNCWEEEPNSRPEFDAIVVRLDCAQKELSVYDNQDSVNLQTTMRKQVCGMLEDLKEKAGELRTKEVALKEQEMALLRRHKDLEQREMDVVQREIMLLLKEKEIDQRSAQSKEKKKDKHRKLGPIISRPRTFEHIVSVKPRDGGLQASQNSLCPISREPFAETASSTQSEENSSPPESEARAGLAAHPSVHQRQNPLRIRPAFLQRFLQPDRKVVEPRAKTWGHRNGELAAAQIRQLSSSTSALG